MSVLSNDRMWRLGHGPSAPRRSLSLQIDAGIIKVCNVCSFCLRNNGHAGHHHHRNFCSISGMDKGSQSFPRNLAASKRCRASQKSVLLRFLVITMLADFEHFRVSCVAAKMTSPCTQPQTFTRRCGWGF